MARGERTKALTIRQQAMSASDGLPRLPSVTNDEAWRVAASTSHVTASVSFVLGACEPNADDKRVALFTRMVLARGYAAAELAYAARELPYDDVVNDKLRFNRPVMPADFERLIKDIRKKRAKLKGSMRLSEAEELVMAFPGDLEIDHFHVCGFDERNRELVRYAPELEPRTPNADPEPRETEGKPYAGARIAETVHVSETDEVGSHLPDEDDDE